MKDSCSVVGLLFLDSEALDRSIYEFKWLLAVKSRVLFFFSKREES